MIIIFGGAYQGKLDYALGAFGLSEKDVQTFSGENTDERRFIDGSKKLYNACHELVLELVGDGVSPVAFFKKNEGLFQDKILLFDETSCGVVPVDARIRKAREENGRVLTALCGRAEQVTRVFCGIPTRVK